MPTIPIGTSCFRTNMSETKIDKLNNSISREACSHVALSMLHIFSTLDIIRTKQQIIPTLRKLNTENNLQIIFHFETDRHFRLH